MSSQSIQEELRQELNAWLARFDLLVTSEPEQSNAAIKETLSQIRKLKNQGGGLGIRMGSLYEPGDKHLVDTFEHAREQLRKLETDTRQLMGAAEESIKADFKESVHQPAGIGEPHEQRSLRSTVFREHIAPVRIGNGCGIGLFALALTAFISIHAVFLISVTYRSEGPIALLLLLFYSIFYAVAGFMASTAWDRMADTAIVLDGTELTRTQLLMGIVRSKTWTIDPEHPAEIVVEPATLRSEGSTKMETVIKLMSSTGKPIKLLAPRSSDDQDRIVEHINSYLAGQTS